MISKKVYLRLITCSLSTALVGKWTVVYLRNGGQFIFTIMDTHEMEYGNGRKSKIEPSDNQQAYP